MIYACRSCLNALAADEVESTLMVRAPIAGFGSSGATANTAPIMAARPEPHCMDPVHGPGGYAMELMDEEEHSKLEGK